MSPSWSLPRVEAIARAVFFVAPARVWLNGCPLARSLGRSLTDWLRSQFNSIETHLCQSCADYSQSLSSKYRSRKFKRSPCLPVCSPFVVCRPIPPLKPPQVAEVSTDDSEIPRSSSPSLDPPFLYRIFSRIIAEWFASARPRVQ